MKKLIAASLLAFGIPMLSSAQSAYGDYPIQGVPFSDVTFADSFWSPRILQNQQTTIPIALEQCYSTGRVANFHKAAALLKGENIGYFGTDYTFDDTDIYKILEGMSYSYKMYPSQELLDSMNSLIGIVAAAQEEDGYLFTARTAAQPGAMHSWVGAERWEYDPDLSHELYNSGHLFEAAVAHYQATGETSLLDVAKKNADLLVEQFLEGGLAYEPGHQIVEMGLVKMYRVTGNENYLKLAKYFLDIRGIQGPNSKHYEYNQSHEAPKEQTEAVGHAVRAVYMYSGMADVAAIMDDSEYLSAVGSLWENMSQKKYYITGGIGALHSGEAFGENYELPNLTAYNETCAAIGNVYWNWRMFLLHGDAKYYDIIERTLYNGVISGISLSGDHFFYPNPLESTGDYSRSEWFGCACCPSNLCRFIASIPGYVYAHKSDSVYVNLFVQGTANISTDNGTITLSQTTDYPWNGDVKLRVDNVSANNTLTLLVRIPGWVKNQPVPGDLYSYLNGESFKPDLQLNGLSIDYEDVNGYMVVKRQWNTGDELTVEFPMDVHRVLANENVSEDIGKVALERGPIVYCLEWPDNDNQIFSAVISDDSEITVERDSVIFSDTNNTVDVLKIRGKNLSYNSEGQVVANDRTFTAIPYYAWANRGEGNMAVWLARTEDVATVSTDSIAGTDTLKYEIGEVAGTEAGVYPSISLTVDRARVAESLGVSFANTVSLYGADITYAAVEPSGSINTTSTANDPGHWFGSDGHVVSWVENPSATTNTEDIPRVFSELNTSTYTFSIGQYPQMCKDGDKYNFRQALTYIPSSGGNPKRVVFDFTVHVSDAATAYGYALKVAQDFELNSLYANVTGTERTALESAIAQQPTTAAEYTTATENLYSAITDFVNSKSTYDFSSGITLDTLNLICLDVPSASGDWTPNYYDMGKDNIAESLGLTKDELTSLYNDEITLYVFSDADTRISSNYNADADGYNGHWLDSNGYYTEFYSGNPRFYYVFDPSDYRVGLGQNGNSPLTAGTTLNTKFLLVYTPTNGDAIKILPISIDYKVVTQSEYTSIDELRYKKNFGKIYNLNGQVMEENMQTLPAGVYIVDGEKVKVK